MASVPEVAASAIQQASDKLVKNLSAMPADKQQWQPLDQGRSAHNQAVECVVINRVAAGVLRDGAFPPFDGAQWGETFAKATAENDTTDKLVASLQKATADLVAATRAFPIDRLDEAIFVPFDGSNHCWSEILFFPYWNMTYHEGQINYIQLLYGDKDMHA